MECKEYEVKVPGKLFIAGEYAVLEPGYESIVVAVDRYVTANIKDNDICRVNLYDINLIDVPFFIGETSVVFDTMDDKIEFIKESFNVVYEFLRGNGVELKPFTLDITSNLKDEKTGQKYGLGSSAAVVVATITAILALHQKPGTRLRYHQDKELIFKLSAIAHVKVQGNGSGADIAAAVYGGWINYRSFDSKWLLKKISQLRKVTDLLDIPWIHLRHEKITPPRRLRLFVGWTKEASKTKGMVDKVAQFKDKEKAQYQQFLNNSKEAVKMILGGFEMDRLEVCITGMKKNHIALKELGRVSGVPIITPEIDTLCNIANSYGAGKSSGAGGGDCGIAFISEEYRNILQHKWNEANIAYLELMVDNKGMVVS